MLQMLASLPQHPERPQLGACGLLLCPGKAGFALNVFDSLKCAKGTITLAQPVQELAKEQGRLHAPQVLDEVRQEGHHGTRFERQFCVLHVPTLKVKKPLAPTDGTSGFAVFGSGVR
jgi:hypothetical protein